MAAVKDGIKSKRTEGRPIDKSVTDSSLFTLASKTHLHDEADEADVTVDTTHSSNATASTSSWHSAISDHKETDSTNDTSSDKPDNVVHFNASSSSLTASSTAPAAEIGENEESEGVEHRPRGSTDASEVDLPDILTLNNLSSPESANASLSPSSFFDGDMEERDVGKTASSKKVKKTMTTVTTASKKTSAVSLVSVTSSDSGIHKSPPHDVQEAPAEAEKTAKTTSTEAAASSTQSTAKKISIVRMRRDDRKTSVDKPPKGDKPRPASCNFSSTSSSSSFHLRMHSVSDAAARTIPLHQQWYVTRRDWAWLEEPSCFHCLMQLRMGSLNCWFRQSYLF